jgi:hypothetical protein
MQVGLLHFYIFWSTSSQGWPLSISSHPTTTSSIWWESNWGHVVLMVHSHLMLSQC